MSICIRFKFRLNLNRNLNLTFHVEQVTHFKFCLSAAEFMKWQHHIPSRYIAMHGSSWANRFLTKKFIKHFTIFGNPRGGEACSQRDGARIVSELPLWVQHTMQVTAAQCESEWDDKHINPHTEDFKPLQMSCSYWRTTELDCRLHTRDFHGDKLSSWGKWFFRKFRS